MATIAETINRSRLAPPTAAEVLTDAVRRVARITHEAQQLKSAADDAVESAVHAAKSAVRRRVRRLDDLRDTATYHVRRRPLAIVSAALAIGIGTGIAFGWIKWNAKCRAVNDSRGEIGGRHARCE